MADIFLSYARADEARAAIVARVLGESGWSVFWDRRIVAGTSWDEVVERELQACRCVVVLWSAASITSKWVKTEARFALQRGTLVPANLDRSEPPLEFRFLESAQLHQWQGATDDSEFSVLSEGIAQHIKPVRPESSVVPAATLTSIATRESASAVAASIASSPVVHELSRSGGSRVVSRATDHAPEQAVRRSWASSLRPQWISVASIAVALVAAVIMYSPLRRQPQVSDATAATPAITTPAPLPETPTDRSRSGEDGTAKSPPPKADAKTEALLAATSPTPRPVPFGAPVRFRPDLWSLPDEPLLGFVEIPAGQFTMGSDRLQDRAANTREFPQHKVDLPRYYIGRYEVTVGQFRAFVYASGYKAHPTDKQGNQADLPVTTVTWYDAVAYATWLDMSLRETPRTPGGVRAILSAGCRVTLPSEAEWEKAARGIDARVFPWGESEDPAKANVGSSGRSAVGSYPGDVSPYGVVDMSGNLWEWTRSLWGSGNGDPEFGYPYDPKDTLREDLQAPDTVRRVARGGSWDTDGQRHARTAYRRGFAPLNRDGNFGFRVAVSCSRS